MPFVPLQVLPVLFYSLPESFSALPGELPCALLLFFVPPLPGQAFLLKLSGLMQRHIRILSARRNSFCSVPAPRSAAAFPWKAKQGRFPVLSVLFSIVQTSPAPLTVLFYILRGFHRVPRSKALTCSFSASIKAFSPPRSYRVSPSALTLSLLRGRSPHVVPAVLP